MPDPGAARAWVWVGVAALALAPLLPPTVPDSHVAVRGEAGCRLRPDRGGPECSCTEFGARLRRVLGWPLDVNAVHADGLELLPGLGPVRAAAIRAERERRGPFRSLDEWARRVHGVGPASVRALRPHLYTEDDPACASGRALCRCDS